jgi:hypothetical protein
MFIVEEDVITEEEVYARREVYLIWVESELGSIFLR